MSVTVEHPTATLDQPSLNRILQSVLGTVATKTTLPMLTNFLLEAEGSQLRVTGTDLDVAMVSSIPATHDRTFRVAVNARRMAEVVRELPKVEVAIEVDRHRVTLRSGSTVIHIPAADADEFPSLPELRFERRITLKGTTLESLIKRTLYATSDDPTNPTLTGALLSAVDGELRMVATDGHRLSRASAKGPVSPFGKSDPIVPPKGLEQVLRLIADDPGDIEIGIDKNHAVFQVASTTVYCRLIEGPFPNYEQVIPKESSREAVMDRGETIAALRRIYSLADNLTHQVKITFSPGQVSLEARTQDIGEGTTDISAEYTGETLTAGYNAQYLLDILKSFDTPTFRMKLNTAVTAAVIEPIGMAEGEELLCLLMPLRLAS